jgi:hypothetical protein
MDDATLGAFCKIGSTKESLPSFFLQGTGNRHDLAWGKSVAEASNSVSLNESTIFRANFAPSDRDLLDMTLSGTYAILCQNANGRGCRRRRYA